MKKNYMVLAGCLFLLTGCGSKEISNYELGTEDLKNKDYTGAIENFELSAAEEKFEVESLRGEGIAYYRQGNYEEAVNLLSSALELIDDSEKGMKKDILQYLASVQYQKADYEGSLASCEALMKLDKSTEAYFLRGRTYLHTNAYKEAESDFNKVLSGSKDYNAYLQIYQVYAECDMKADGEAFLERALELPGEKEEDRYNRGRVYYYLKEYDSAKKELTESYNNGYKSAAIYLGKVYVELGDTANARAMYKECLSDKDLQAKAYNGIAYCDIIEEDYASALTNIQSGLEAGDTSEKQALLFNEIVTYEKMADYASAKEKMTAYLNLYPTDAAAVKENYFLETR